MSEVHRGTVKWFNNSKGFGFIEHPDGRDVFVHYSVIESDGYRSLKDGEVVEYEIKEGPKGFHAVRVSRADNEESAKVAIPAGGESSEEDESEEELPQ